jgi:transcriptional regulator with XRE-family HTH domain
MTRSPNSVDKLVGQNIRIFRTAKRLSQTELGNVIGVTFQQLQKYEKGTNRIGSGRLSQIADALDVPISRFFEGATRPAEPRTGSKNNPKTGPVVTDLLSDRYAVQTLQAFSKIDSPKLRRAVLKLIESIGGRPKR